MAITELGLNTLVLGPHEHRSNSALDILGQPGLVKLSGSDTNDAMATVYLIVPKHSGPPLHRHSHEDEWFYVLDGEVTFEVDGKRYTAGAGSSVYAPRGTMHAFQNFHDMAVHMLVTVIPAGLERFFEELTAQSKGLSQPDFAKVEQLMNTYGLELMGPPLS